MSNRVNKNYVFIIVFGLLLGITNVLTAQNKSTEKKPDHSSMQKGDMHKCMDKIASDEHMKGEMMTKMMEHAKGDSTSMMKMCKTMMDNPEMHKMMMKMMQGNSKDHKGMMMEGKKMKHNKEPEVNKTSDHEEHHKK